MEPGSHVEDGHINDNLFVFTSVLFSSYSRDDGEGLFPGPIGKKKNQGRESLAFLSSPGDLG